MALHTIRLCIKSVRSVGEAAGNILLLQTRNPYVVRNLSWNKRFSVTAGSPSHSGQNSSLSRQISVGVVGAGRNACSVHIPTILGNHRAQLRWVVEDKQENIETVKRGLYTEVPFYSSDHLESLLDDSSITAVFVFSPAETHHDVILSALQKGKAVFTEKPTAGSITDIETLYDAAASVGRPLLTGFNRRFDPSYRHVYDLHADGQLGKLQICKLTVRDSPKPSHEQQQSTDTSGCGILNDLAVHDFDFLAWLTKSAAPESIYVVAHAHGPMTAETRHPDISMVTMKYPDGAIVLMDTARESRYGYDSRVELFGSEGMASSVNPRQSLATKNIDIGALQRPMMYSFDERFRNSFELQLDHFLDCVEGKSSPSVTKEDCVLTALMVEAAVESCKEEKLVNFQEFLSSRAA